MDLKWEDQAYGWKTYEFPHKDGVQRVVVWKRPPLDQRFAYIHDTRAAWNMSYVVRVHRTDTEYEEHYAEDELELRCMIKKYQRG